MKTKGIRLDIISDHQLSRFPRKARMWCTAVDFYSYDNMSQMLVCLIMYLSNDQCKHCL